jgi:hypothetical protein
MSNAKALDISLYSCRKNFTVVSIVGRPFLTGVVKVALARSAAIFEVVPERSAHDASAAGTHGVRQRPEQRDFDIGLSPILDVELADWAGGFRHGYDTLQVEWQQPHVRSTIAGLRERFPASSGSPPVGLAAVAVPAITVAFRVSNRSMTSPSVQQCGQMSSGFHRSGCGVL